MNATAMQSNSDTSIHRALHHKDENGRDQEIETYVKASFDFYADWLGRNDTFESFFDLGADYGFAMECAEKTGMFNSVYGCEPFPQVGIRPLHDNVQHVDLINVTYPLADANVFINHVLEHLPTPLDTLNYLHARGASTVFVAVPNAQIGGDSFVGAPGHLHTMSPIYFTHIIPANTKWKLVKSESVCFRQDFHEYWAIFLRAGF